MERDGTPVGPFLDVLQQFPLEQLERDLEKVRNQMASLSTDAQLLELAIARRRRQSGTVSDTNGDAATAKPTLKRAIVAVMGDGEPGEEWGPAAIHQALSERGWAPTGKSARNQIQSRLADLLDRGQINRVGDGRYVLLRN